MLRETLTLTPLIFAFLVNSEYVYSEPARPAKFYSVSVGDSQFLRTFPATSEAGEHAVLSFRVPGQVVSMDVLEGQTVSKGQILAELDINEYKLIERKARAQLTLTEVQLDRAKKLKKDQVISEQDFDSSEANYNSAKASWEQAKLNLSYASLKAPYDGQVSFIDVNNFEFVGANQPVISIQTDQALKVVFQLPEHLLNRYSQTEMPTVNMTFDAFPDNEYPLEFLEIDTEADNKTGSYKVTMIMQKPDDVGVLPGMSGTVKVKAISTKPTPIPDNALVFQQNKTFVWRVTPNQTVEKVEVVLDDNQQIVKGLKNGDEIISAGVDSLSEGMKVRRWVKERGL